MKDSLRTIVTEHPLFKSIFSIIAAFIFDEPNFVIVMVALVIIDLVTGVLYAWMQHTISSARFARGALKLFGYVAVVAALHWVGMYIELLSSFDKIVLGWFCVTELISIIENAGKLGVPIPRFVLQRLETVRQSFNEKETRNG